MKKVMLRTNDTSVDQAQVSHEDISEIEKHGNIVVHVKKAVKKEPRNVKKTDLKSGQNSIQKAKDAIAKSMQAIERFEEEDP